MRRYFFLAFGTMLTSLFLLVACAPKPLPTTLSTPSPATVANTSVPSTPTLAAPPEDAAWQKVMESARQEGRLTIYSYSMIGDVAIVTSRAFQDRYGIKVDIVSGRQFQERITTEQRTGQMVGDLMDASASSGMSLKIVGGTVSIGDLPVLREKNTWRLHPLTVDPEGHLLAHRMQLSGPWVNTGLVKPGQEPKSYRDLAKLDWKGKIGLPDPSLSNQAYIIFYSLVDKGYLDMDFVASLAKQDLKFVPATRDVAFGLSKGQFLLGLMSEIDGAGFVAEGAPIKPVAFEEGTVVSLATIEAIKGGPHPNAAKLFMNWLFGPEGQSVYNRALSMLSVRSDVPDFRPAAAAVTAKRLVPLTAKDFERQSQAFRDKDLVKLWKN